MLPVPFSFAGRIGRWSFFKASAALSISGILPVILVIAFAGALRSGNTAAWIGLVVLVALFAAVVFWIGLTLQTRRCRDIGCNPLVAMMVVAGVQVSDLVLAHLMPGISRSGGTVLGSLFNLGWMLCLLFWPSSTRDVTGSLSHSGLTSHLPRSRVEALKRHATRSVDPATKPASTPGRLAFGRR